MRTLFILSVLIYAGCTSSRSRLEIGNQFFEKKEYLKAIENLQQVDDQAACERDLLLGHSYWSLQNYSEAIKIYSRYVKMCEPDLTVHNNMGDSYFKLEQGDSSYYHLITAYEIDPTHPTVNFNLGMINYTSSYDSDAKFFFKKAIQFAAELDFDNYDMLIEVHNQLQEFDSSFVVAEELIHEANEEQDIYRAMLAKAFIYGDMERYEKCRDEINNIIERNELNSSNTYSAYYNRYLCHYMLNDTSKACADYRLLIAENPENKPENYYNCQL